jgi:uncharacterized membrane protein YdfJ with MMPL/SSD domain
MKAKSIAARAGYWSATHPKTAIFGWLAFVVVALYIGGQVGTKKIPDSERGTGESGNASQVLHKSFQRPAEEQVLVQSSSDNVHQGTFRSVVDDVAARVSRAHDVVKVESPYQPGNSDQLSADGHSALLIVKLRGDPDTASDRVAPSLAATAAAQRAHPGYRIGEFGEASAMKAFEKAFSDDLAKSRFLSLPITLLILLVVFGALAAAGIPLLLAFSSVLATMGMVAVASQIAPVDEVAVSEVVLLIGMAVGVDYSLFYMRRQREERSNGHDNATALQIAAATSGRSVMVSGFTVMTAMAGMYFTGDKSSASQATGMILVVAVAMIGSLTVLPAMLSKFGDGVMKGRVPFVSRRRERNHGESRLFGAIIDRVLRRPKLAVVVAGGALVALSIPVIGMHTADSGVRGLPQGLAGMKTLDRIEAAFPGGPTPAQVVVQARDVTAPQVQHGVQALKREALATGQMGNPVAVDVNKAHTVAVVSIAVHGDGTDATSTRALETLREQVIPSTVGRVPGAEVSVGGMTAESKDYSDSIKSHAPLVFGFVLAMAFALLLFTFRSIVIPIKAILLNLLSVGAAYGVMVLVFQHGIGQSLLGFESTGAISSWLPLFIFVILFGLSMDYHVFILTRVREAYDRGMSTEDAVAHGIKSTAGVVTSAAIVMVAVFGIFATLSALDFKMLGVGLATAVLIDATVVRAVLLPATMKLLGDWNWYLPSWLGWLPGVSREPAALPSEA